MKDRLIFVGLYRLAPSTVNVLTIVNPETVVRWHRASSDRTGAGNHDLVLPDRRWAVEIRRLIRDEHFQSDVGNAAGSVASCLTRHRDRPDQRRQIRGEAKTSSVTRVGEHLSAIIRRHRRYGSICRTDNNVSIPLWFIDMGQGWRHIL